jgi:tetratricopeptide (TPR) repeat protein
MTEIIPHHHTPAADLWSDDNARGLAFAADGDWPEATEAFAAAADALVRALPLNAGAHEPLAMVLSNLAQATFRMGRYDEAVQHAQRTCALRVALAGEDGMPVARARMDLAVMLATVGRRDEAMSLVQRAIATLDHRVGEEDARLVVLLENAARIALAAGAPATAEPYLLRLHALLDAHELSTRRAELLLERVAAVRAHQGQDVHSAERSHTKAADTPVIHDTYDDGDTKRVYVHASVAEQQQWEDQPLRDAVALTDVLLRTTPAGIPAVPPPAHERPHDPSIFPAPAAAAMPPMADMDLDLADSLGDLDLSPTDAPSAAIAELADRLPNDAAAALDSALVLDFLVQHGVTDENTDTPPTLAAAPIASPVPGALDVGFTPPPTADAPKVDVVNAGSTSGIARMPGMLGSEVPAGSRADAARPSAERTAAPRERPPAPPHETKRGGSRLPYLLGAAAAAAAGAAAWFFLLR